MQMSLMYIISWGTSIEIHIKIWNSYDENSWYQAQICAFRNQFSAILAAILNMQMSHIYIFTLLTPTEIHMTIWDSYDENSWLQAQTCAFQNKIGHFGRHFEYANEPKFNHFVRNTNRYTCENLSTFGQKLGSVEWLQENWASAILAAILDMQMSENLIIFSEAPVDIHMKKWAPYDKNSGL